MQEIIDRILGGNFDYENGSLEFSCAKIEISLSQGTIYEGSFHILSASEGYVKGSVISDHLRMECMTDQFTGSDAEIFYCFHGEDLEEGDVIKGSFSVVSNRGEYNLPFVVTVEHGMLNSSIGAIRNLFHFANLAKSNWKEAVRLFYDPEFLRLFQGNDAHFYDSYRILSTYEGNEQNVEELLEYQQKIQESGTILMIVGGGPYLETLRKKAAELGVTESVIFTGMVSPAEVASYYPAGDLFVSASTSETQGLTYAEALAAGLPLLCRRDQCLRAVVEEGKNGWQYRTEEEFLKDLKNWKEKEDDERRGMCSYAKQSAEIFSQKRFAGSMEQLYQRQIEEKQVEREKRLAKSRQYCILG